MSESAEKSGSERLFRWLSAGIFCIAIGLVALLVAKDGADPRPPPDLLLFLFGFGWLAIVCGFPHPYYGHVSFDRIAQFAAVLIVGPLAAAIINMAASFIYPWGRLLHGESLTAVATAALANAGMMALVILAGGYAYLLYGGTLPLLELSPDLVFPLIAMALCAHLSNDLLMVLLVWARGGTPHRLFNRFTLGIESFSFVLAVLVALIWNSTSLPIFLLFMAVLCVAMFQIRQLGLLRVHLHELVQTRTAELEKMARTDDLTGLANRRHAYEWLQSAIQNAADKRAPLSVVMVDLDHFKSINDEYSHQIGDQVLSQVAKTLSRSLQPVGMAARIGGEEFMLGLSDCDAKAANASCETLRQTILELQFAAMDKAQPISASFGIAEWQGESGEELLKRADQALYRAKDRGRNCVVTHQATTSVAGG